MNPSFPKLHALALFVAAGLVASAPSVADGADEKLENVRERISGMFEAIEPEHVNIGPIDGWYEVQNGSIIAYVSEDGRYLMQGDLIDLEASVNLTDISRNEARREIMASVDKDHVISFAPAEVKYSVSVFTDVGCAYCRRLHNQIDDYLAQGIEVRYLLYPRNGPASKDWKISEQVWCAADRNDALTAAKLDRSFESSSCDASIIQDTYVLGQKIGLSGTPTIVLEDGTLIGGYLPAAALAQRLEQNKAATAAARR